MCRSSEIDVIVDVTGSVEFGPRDSRGFEYANGGVDEMPRSMRRSARFSSGCAQAQCDPFGMRGDEPGLQMNLYAG